VLERPAALQKLTRYLRENVRATGSVSSISMFCSGFSTLVWLRKVTAPFPISPAQENLTPSLDASIETSVDVNVDPTIREINNVVYRTLRVPSDLRRFFETR